MKWIWPQSPWSTGSELQVKNNPHVLQAYSKICCVKTTHLLPQCQGLQTYSSHHREWGLLQQMKWAARVLAKRLLLWPVVDGVNCRVQEKRGERLTTPHLHSSSKPVLKCQFVLFMDPTVGVPNFKFPLFHVLRLYVSCFYPNLHMVVPAGPETKQRGKML